MSTISRKTEVTKLITVTLGKIQESKHAKCGLNLRKSLLVASVLHKARDIYVTEVKNRVVDHTDSSKTSNNNNNNNNEQTTNVSPPAKKVRRFATQRSMSVIEEEPVTSSLDSDTSADSSLAIRPSSVVMSSNDDEIVSTTTTPAPFTQSTDATVVDDILDELATNSEVEYTTSTDKENNPPTDHSSLATSVTSCGRCLKRRASTDYVSTSEADSSSSESLSFVTPYYLPKKRSRSNSVDNSDTQTSDEISKPCSMDTTQINSLVSIFSQSFPEFTSTEVQDASSVYETSTEMNTFALCRDSIALTA